MNKKFRKFCWCYKRNNIRRYMRISRYKRRRVLSGGLNRWKITPKRLRKSPLAWLLLITSACLFTGSIICLFWVGEVLYGLGTILVAVFTAWVVYVALTGDLPVKEVSSSMPDRTPVRRPCPTDDRQAENEEPNSQADEN